MRIGAREISSEAPPFVIAEIGVNHDGSIARALELVDAAARVGADAVKAQVFRARLLMSRSAILASYQREAGEEDPVAMLERLELDDEALRAVARRAHDRGLHAIATVFSLPLVATTERLGFDAYKSASPDIVHEPLLRALARTGRPLIVSTGGASLAEVLRARGWLDGSESIFLQCVSAYPTPRENASLRGIGALARALGEASGYSDHTTQVETGALAVAAGACVIEKHLTLDRRAKGPDHAASLEPDDFARFVRLIREAWRMLGPCEKAPLPVETDVRRASRQSIVSAGTIRRGSVIGAADIAYKRPGDGFEPWRSSEVIGRVAARDIGPDELLTGEDFA